MSLSVKIEHAEMPSFELKIANPRADAIYLLPTSHNGDNKPAYFTADGILLKQAASHGVNVVYALPEEEREFVDHFSSGLELISFAVAVANLVPSTIQGIYAMIQIAAWRKGISEDAAANAEVRLKIGKLRTDTVEMKGVELSGTSAGVVEALESLRAEW